MEAKGGLTTAAGVTVVSSNTPIDYQISLRPEKPTHVAGAPTGVLPAPQTVAKKKRGRPRKYKADGSVAAALAARPAIIDFTAGKRLKVKPSGSLFKLHQPKFQAENLGEWKCTSVGANFTPHFITINAGEDVTKQLISFSQQSPRALCILSATGTISNVALHQPDSSGGTLTYEGRFEILSLTGSFMPCENGGVKSRSGGMSVSLASPDGRVVGGRVAGLLLAASVVQIVVGSFLAGNQHEKKPNIQKPEYVISRAAVPITNIRAPRSFGSPAHNISRTASVNLESSFYGDKRSSLPSEGQDHLADKYGSLHWGS